MGKLGAIALIVMIMAPLPAIAYTQEDANACTPDALRLCQNAIPDASRVAQCLVQNRQQLSPACTSVFNRSRDASVDRERSVKLKGIITDRVNSGSVSAACDAKRTCKTHRSVSAFGGKADTTRTSQPFRQMSAIGGKRTCELSSDDTNS